MNPMDQSVVVKDEGGMEVSTDGREMSWEAKISLINNRFMQWATFKFLLALAPVLLLAWGLMAYNDPYAKTPLRGTLVLTGLSLVAIYLLFQFMYLVFFFNRYCKRFLLTPQGVGFATSGGTRVLISLVSILSGTAGAAGGNMGLTSGALMQSAQMDRFVPWGKVRKAVVYNRSMVISLKNSWRVVMRIYCPNREVFQAALDKASRHCAGVVWNRDGQEGE